MDLEFQVVPEDLARSLIREFFLKQNLKSSLQAFENEDTRPRVKMTKIDLIKLLSMERLIKNNKIKAQPQQTMLEILTDYLFSKFKSRSVGLNTGDLTNQNADSLSVNNPNIRNQEFSGESVYGSQTNIQNKITGQQSYNQNIPFKDNSHIHSAGANSHKVNGVNNGGINSYQSSKIGHPSSGLNSQISNNDTSASSRLTQNSNIHHQAHILEQQKPPKAAGPVITNNNIFGNSEFIPSSSNNKIPQQMKNPLQEKGADYLSILEEQNKRGSNTQNFQQNTNSTNLTANSTASPFSGNVSDKKINSQNDNDDGEFKFESRRGNMKKVVRQPSNDRKVQPNQSEQVTSIRTSMNGFAESNNSNITSNATTSKNQNSEFFANFNEVQKSDNSQNSKLDFNDPIFGEISSDSRIITKIPNNDKQVNQELRPQSRQNNKTLQLEQQQQQQQQGQQNINSKSSAKEEEEERSKQFNFFNKMKKELPSQSDLPNKELINEVDEFDQMLGAGQGTTASRQFENVGQKKKKGIFDDDEDLDFSNNNARNKRRDSQLESTQQNQQNTTSINDIDHVKMNFFEPGVVNFDFIPPKINFQKTSGIQTFSKKSVQNISGSDIQEIRKLLFSQSQNKFLPTSWAQGFILNENDDTFYGLFQKEGGPCGVIACVQAFYLKYLFYVYPTQSKNSGKDLQDYKNKTLRENCLIAALAEILFNARGDDNTLRLAVIQNTSAASSTTQSIPIESCGYISVKAQTIEQAYDAMHAYKSDYIGQHNHGVTTFLYSVIFTKGVKAIQSEMDTADNALIGHHGHCSQEQVNLFLTGKARSNCFDGEKVLDGDYKLKGIDSRAPFGFLTIFEHLKYIEVGSYLKTPLFPIWIICKEYHYSVIFAKDYRASEKSNQPHFDLVYYDELYNPEDRIILTVTQKKYAKQSYTSSSASNQQHFMFNRKDNKKGDNEEDEDMIPVIELVMRTKWGKEISVDWNGTQPIL